ncbi:LacI family DNA-binding transcriptional regulator [Konateibacter massiliensis]|uniref:LacI family DNA-binding transcriptional regulator n=1 Tax=Konateibacter massiliensis TaxID=2002841 RepID=UPI000C15C3F5|nr:LacI family DNA-binding transcriptional regulator [Konateibacter massiliensis]
MSAKNREISESNKKLTIADIADELGVSKTTVSRSISGNGRIGAKTKERVLKYIQEHDYKPNVMAKGLAQSKTYNICVAYPTDCATNELPFFQKCLIGIVQRAAKEQYDILIAMVSNTDISQLKRIVQNNKVDGAIILRTLMDDSCVKFLKQSNLPFVTVGSTSEKGVIQVDNDNLAACRGLTMLLLTEGVERIALIGGNTQHVVTQNRCQGFKEAFEKWGKNVDSRMVYLDMEDTLAIENCVEDALRKQAECIIAMDDIICKKILDKLKQDQVDVPRDIKVASFYHSEELDKNIPSITSIKFDVPELGTATCNTLFSIMEGKEVQPKTVLGYEMILKESTVTNWNR